jgi:flagellar export protein FliJ
VKRYRFPLAAVMRVRKIEEDQAISAFAAAERHRVAAEEQASHREASHHQVVPAEGVRTLDEFLASRERHERSAAALLDAREEVAQARMASMARRAALAAAASAVSALEHLDDKGRAEHAIEAQREEAVEIDDLVTGRHRRGHR